MDIKMIIKEEILINNTINSLIINKPKIKINIFRINNRILLIINNIIKKKNILIIKKIKTKYELK